MFKISAKDIEAILNEENGTVSLVSLGNHQISSSVCPIFAVRLRNKDGECFYIDSTKGKMVSKGKNDIVYSLFDEPFSSILVKVEFSASAFISWEIEIESVPENYTVEWVEFPKVCMPRLIDNDPQGGKILFPYDEGILLTNETLLPRYEPDFPMSGAYFIFQFFHISI